MATAKLKFRKSLPLPAEMFLCQKLGFYVSDRKSSETVIEFAKFLTPNRKKVVHDITKLDPLVKQVLLNKCERIVGHYHDPELMLRSIRARVNNLASTYDGAERQFIKDWIEANLSDDQ